MTNQPFTASFFDRLISSASELDDDVPPQTDSATFIASVARDIEALLNCRNVLKKVRMPGSEGTWPANSPVDRSVLMLGLPDFSALSLANGYHRDALAAAVRDAITIFEPRLADVEVRIPEGARACASLQFSITARLNVPNLSSPVIFEAAFQSTNLQFSVAPSPTDARHRST